MELKLYFNRKGILLAIVMALIANINLKAQIYKDTTNLVKDIEAGIFEEIILAPASAKDTFFLPKQVTISSSVTIKALDGLGFKPVVTGNLKSKPSYLFSVSGINGGAEILMKGVRLIGSIKGKPTVTNGTFTIKSEKINLNIVNCDFMDFPGYNAVAKVFNSGGNITLDNVLVYNCGGKIIQVNYKDDLSTPNYVPLIGDLSVKNSTFAKIYNRMFLELGSGSVVIDPVTGITASFNAGAKNINIDHCTFYGFEGVGVLNSKMKYTFAGNQAAVKEKLSITNSIFSKMDKNMDMDSASVIVIDNNYFDFGRNLGTSILEDLSKYKPANTKTVAPLFANTSNGAWDLRLQNKDQLIGSDGKPIGDPRWWNGTWTNTKQILNKEEFARIFSYQNLAVIETNELKGEISVYDFLGKIIRKSNITSSRTEIELPGGLYIVQVQSNKGRIAKKVLVE